MSVEEELKRIGRLLMGVLMTATLGSVGSAQSAQVEYAAKARFLSTAPGFVEWPAEAFQGPTAPLRICVYGEYPFGIGLAELVRNSFVKGHPLEVKWARKEQDLAGCQIVFVSRSEAKRYDKVLEALKNSNALTVGEEAGFLQAGGMVSVQSEGSGVWFDVNLNAVNQGHLKLSSQMLALARHIVRGTEAAKS